MLRLDAQLGTTCEWKGAFDGFEEQQAANYEPIRGNSVDLPVTAGTCEPGRLVPPALWQQVQNPLNIFPLQTTSVCGAIIHRGTEHRHGYIQLVVRELHCGKLRLRTCVGGVARVFAAAKSTEGRQRKIWDGALLSQLAARPPKPRRLANPASFQDIIVRPGETLYMSKRDASTYFDVLLPSRVRD